MCWWCLLHKGMWPVRPELRRMVIHRYSAGELDPPNFTGGCKGLIDAVVYEGLVYDDKRAYCRIEYEQHKARPKEGRTEVEVFA